MTDSLQALLELVRYGLGLSDRCVISDHAKWEEVMTLADLHGVSAVAFDAIQRFQKENVPIEIDLDTKLEWIGLSHLQEIAYQRQEDTISFFARFYHQYNIKMMVLKGWGLSLNYPVPSHRPNGDLDIYLFGEQEWADKLLETELGINVDHSHHHHTVFVYNDVTVENHYDFLNIYSHRSTKKLEECLKSMAEDAASVKTKDDTDVWLPSANFNSLFVLRHCAGHFAAEGVNLRMVLDWGLFVKKYNQEVDWDHILPIIKELNMHKFLDAVNYICYTYLGFDENIFVGFGDESYGERVFEDLFNPANLIQSPKGFIKYIVFRFKKWWAARWKHRIVYSDSLLSTFFYQVHAHLMKPSTLVNK